MAAHSEQSEQSGSSSSSGSIRPGNGVVSVGDGGGGVRIEYLKKTCLWELPEDS